MADNMLAGDAIGASPDEETCARLVDRDKVATFMERHAERLVAGPAHRDFGAPINRNRHEPSEATAIRTAIYSLAQSVRTGISDPEADWPQASGYPEPQIEKLDQRIRLALLIVLAILAWAIVVAMAVLI